MALGILSFLHSDSHWVICPPVEMCVAYSTISLRKALHFSPRAIARKVMRLLKFLMLCNAIDKGVNFGRQPSF